VVIMGIQLEKLNGEQIIKLTKKERKAHYFSGGTDSDQRTNV